MVIVYYFTQHTMHHNIVKACIADKVSKSKKRGVVAGTHLCCQSADKLLT